MRRKPPRECDFCGARICGHPRYRAPLRNWTRFSDPVFEEIMGMSMEPQEIIDELLKELKEDEEAA